MRTSALSQLGKQVPSRGSVWRLKRLGSKIESFGVSFRGRRKFIDSTLWSIEGLNEQRVRDTFRYTHEENAGYLVKNVCDNFFVLFGFKKI